MKKNNKLNNNIVILCIDRLLKGSNQKLIYKFLDKNKDMNKGLRLYTNV